MVTIQHTIYVVRARSKLGLFNQQLHSSNVSAEMDGTFPGFLGRKKKRPHSKTGSENSQGTTTVWKNTIEPSKHNSNASAGCCCSTVCFFKQSVYLQNAYPVIK